MRNYLAVLILLLSSLPTFASMEEALDAYKKGNYGAAIQELNRLGEAGDVFAQIMLGALYNKGGAVVHDDKIAASWFEKAANQENTEAQYQLGYLYENSDLPKDYATAASWYHKAAQRGSAKAQFRLGVFYSGGLGVTKNMNESILWLGKAALQENTDAQFMLGLMYYLGKTVPKNKELAKGWLTKAASQNHSDALLLLAGMYKKGEAGPKDPILAYSLSSLAVVNRIELKKEADEMRDDLISELTPEQIVNGDKLAAELQKPDNFSQALNTYIIKAHRAPFRFFERPDK
ncbi:MAG: sel1 repeat family protein [Gammaproteobacteria bacterium]|nr:MAG: sel1 repeat family protein [Gammaproteobacteria bacterium]